MGATRLYVIRHGETAHNARRILQPPDVPLSERGREQARRLARRLAALGVGRILSSDLARAAETAGALVEATGLDVAYDPLLQERNFGDLRGTRYDELEEDPFAPDYVPPGGESWDAFRARVAGAWRAIQQHAARAEGPLAVVTHGLVVRDLVERHLDVPTALARPAEPHAWRNTCLTIADGPTPWRVHLLACTAHLDVVEFGDGPPSLT